MADEKLAKILYYARRGWAVMPVHWIRNGGTCSCGNPNCKSPGKHPATTNGFYDATTDAATIRTWHSRAPESNWGIRTGSISKLAVVDIDPRNGGAETWESLRQAHPEPIETIQDITGGEIPGTHYWFATNGSKIGNAVLGPGVDFLGEDHMVVVAPSRTVNEYKFKLSPVDTELAPLPDWIAAAAQAAQQAKKAQTIVPADGAAIPPGQRHLALTRLAGKLRREGLEIPEIEAALLAFRNARCSGNQTDAEIHEIAVDIGQKERGYHLTDLGNAERFVDKNGDDMRYCYDWERWLFWDGRRWATDDSSEAKRRAHGTVRSIYIEAANCNDTEYRKKLVSFGIASEARFRLAAMVEEAKPYMVVQPRELDRDRLLLNVNNGVIDLCTGELLPHDKNRYMTKLAPVDFDPHAECPQWDKFLRMITGNNEELMYFLQLAVGYTLTGSIDEQCLFLLIGTGSNGKSTFVETIRMMMGDYTTRAKIEALMQAGRGRDGNGQEANSNIASMAGARFVISTEVPGERRISESLIKDLTGGESITTRRLYQESFTFEPSHKIWIYGNHLPKTSGSDDFAFWRRMRVVPFNVTIPEDVRRPMSEVLNTFRDELPGILCWAVTGAVLWNGGAKMQSDAVKTATKDYRSESDMVQQFLDEKCENHPDYTVKKESLWVAWRDWCAAEGEADIGKRGKRWFTQQLTRKDYRPCGDGNTSLAGLRLAPIKPVKQNENA